MTSLIEWWCHLVGISDPGAIQIALGIAGAASAFFVAYLILIMIMAAIEGISSGFR
jgi:hypothetical protein